MSDTLEMTGSVKLINDTQEFSSGFSKREFVISTPGDYSQDIKFEVVKDNCAKLDNLSPGQTVTVSFNIRGNEYNGKYYVNLLAWKLDWSKGGSQSAAPKQQSQQSSAPSNSEEDDDIPF